MKSIARSNYGNRATPADLRESAELRQRWLRWCSLQGISVAQAIRDMGYKGSKSHPKWSSDGNIPEDVRWKMKRQLGEVAA